jgi:hypothetical protein
MAKCLHEDIFQRRAQQTHRHNVIFTLAAWLSFGRPQKQQIIVLTLDEEIPLFIGATNLDNGQLWYGHPPT